MCNNRELGAMTPSKGLQGHEGYDSSRVVR